MARKGLHFATRPRSVSSVGTNIHVYMPGIFIAFVVLFFPRELSEQERVSAGMSCMALDGATAAGGTGAEDNDDATKLETGETWLHLFWARDTGRVKCQAQRAERLVTYIVACN